jgi:Secretory lipase
MAVISTLLTCIVSLAWATVTPPSQDPFYTPTGNWQSQKPGAILNHRNVPNNLPNVTYSAAYQLLFRTTDALGNPIAAITTVIIPNTPDYSKLLSYQIVYDTPDIDCSPSYTMQVGGSNAFDNGFTYGLDEGWIVNTADYEGPKAAFTAGIISGQATLDSIRAALASTSITKLQSNATVAMWGYSGGVSTMTPRSYLNLTQTGPRKPVGCRTAAQLCP